MIAPSFRHSQGPILTPQPGVPWADTMVLNPSLVADPVTKRLHMLFRATGPWPQARREGRPMPFPIFLGYAWSDDNGATWQADWTRPALAPALAETPEMIRVRAPDGRTLVNHANGCVEDPRLGWIDGELHLTVACRMFPPGPYWEHDEPIQCAPEWAKQGDNPLGRAARENLTVTVLYRVDLSQLAARNYEGAFTYLTHLTDPERADNRDVFLFPSRLPMGGRLRYVALHRPFAPQRYGAPAGTPPCIYLAAADRIEDLPTDAAEHRLFAQSLFPWEANRTGASWVPLSLDDGQWLISYHGKQDATVGYTQGFIITRNDSDGWPVVAHRCPDRLLYASEPWHLEGRFRTPCVFTCGGIVHGADLLMTYGAADTTAGLVRVNFSDLIDYVRGFDADGRRR